jgi:arylsulfatase A-like enzyme
MLHVAEMYRQASELALDQLPPLPDNYSIPPGEPDAIERHLSPKAVTPAITMRQVCDEKEWRIDRWIYCRLTEQVDEKIGRILRAVKKAGLDEQTLILFTSDHGNVDAHHRLASKGLFYEASARVPLLMRFKGDILPGRVDEDHLVSTGLDILPTLCDYAGIAPPKNLLGSSLRPIAQGRRIVVLPFWASRPLLHRTGHRGRLEKAPVVYQARIAGAFQFVQQLLTQLGYGGGVRRIGCHVIHLVRIFLQVEQLLAGSFPVCVVEEALPP